jgi:hypothetical protein
MRRPLDQTEALNRMIDTHSYDHSILVSKYQHRYWTNTYKSPVFLLVDSSSMRGGSWHKVKEEAAVIAPICTEHDDDIIDIHFSNWFKRFMKDTLETPCSWYLPTDPPPHSSRKLCDEVLERCSKYIQRFSSLSENASLPGIGPVSGRTNQPPRTDQNRRWNGLSVTENKHRSACCANTVIGVLFDGNDHIESSELHSGLWSSVLQFIRSTKPIAELTAIRLLLAMIPRAIAPPPWGDLETLHLQDLAYVEGRRILWEGLYLAVARFAAWILRRRHIPDGVRNRAAEMLITVLSNAGCMFMAAVSAMLAISYSRLLAGDHSFKPWYVAQIEGDP